MICPKCKTKVSDEDVYCPHCNLKLIFTCPRCKEKVHLGPSSCPNCGYEFIKICPECKTKNFAWSANCRKCKAPLNLVRQNRQERIKKAIEKSPTKAENKKILNIPSLNSSKEETKPIEEKPIEENKPFLFYIDFTNLDKAFERYNQQEFKEKVIQNIKTTIKIVFNTSCDFVSSHCVMFKFNYNKQTNILKIIEEFSKEFQKFNEILEKTLSNGLTYKFAISTIDEVRKNKEVNQLKYGNDRDIIVSSGAYSKLSGELSLIKIAQDSYKMVLLDTKPIIEQSEDEKYDKTLQIILENLEDNNSKVRAISVNAPRGAGKTHLLDNLCYQFLKANHKNTLLFQAKCSALTQVSPYGLIQSFFVSLFETPVVLENDFSVKDFENIVLNKLNLDKIDEDKLETLANLIYPIKKDYWENILINKELTYKCLKDVFEYLKKKKKIVFVIDDFDLIDESSYGFLKYLVENDYFKNDAKLILGYKNKHSISMYFQTNKFDNTNCLNISLRTLNTSENKIFVKKFLGQDSDIPNEILSQIAYNAQGNITYIEQIIQYMLERRILTFDGGNVKFQKEFIDIEFPSTLEKCFEDRLEFLKDTAKDEYVFLTIASLLGDSLNFDILSRVFELSKDDYFALILKLAKKGYLKRKYEDVYGFKNSLTWSYCYIRAKEDETIKEYIIKLLNELHSKVTSTPLICPILAQISGNKELAFNLWTESLRNSNYIGDVNIYAMAQKQALILLENIKSPNVEYIKNNICERLGKLVYDKNPFEAKDYLTNVIVAVENSLKTNPENKEHYVNRIIDLSGFLIKSLYLIQDYTGVVEVVDNVLKYFSQKEAQDKKYVHELKVALIKSRKLEALLHLGSWQDVTTLVNIEITPTLQRNLNVFTRHKWITTSDIVQNWFEANITLATSYAEQGSPLAFELINKINKELSKESDSKADGLKVKLAYALAIANTAQGNVDESDGILQEILTDYSYVIDSPNMVNLWNIISLINKILRQDFDTIKNELFEASAYANNCGDDVAKNLIKTLLAYVLLEEKSYLKAIEVASEQMQYFSSKKIAFGALLAWYITASATVYNNTKMNCVEICEKAVKICDNVPNNNYYFKILFQELLAKIYLKQDDKESAKMYCDMALQSAIQNELYYLQARLNLLKTTIAREYINSKPEKEKHDYAQNILKMYSRTMDLARRINLDNMVKKINKEQMSFRAFCQLNRIIEDK